MRTALNRNSQLHLSIGSGTRVYIIDDMIGSGATCLAYSAHYEDAFGHKQFVRIKECYPYDAHIIRDGAYLHWSDLDVKHRKLERFRSAYQKSSDMQNTHDLRNSTAHVFDLCESNGTLYAVMDMTEGKTFDCDTQYSLQDLLKTTLALTRVIEKYHQNGYLHLDIKPSNFLVLQETRELVVLFDMDTVTPLTEIRAGGLVNLPYSKGWAAPEQIQGKLRKFCPATDLYAIGAILFEKLFNRQVSSKDMGIFAKWDYNKTLCSNENPKVRRLPTEIFHKTLSANIRRRYQSASELAFALEEAIRVVDKGTPYLITTSSASHINFVGRQEELQRIDYTFKNGKKCVFLQGFGGIGKTELAKKYAEAYTEHYEHIAFLRYSENQNSINSLLLNNIKLANYEDDPNLKENERREKRLQKIKELLSPKVLIILDNYDVETPDGEFMDLLNSDASLLITTRTDFSYLSGQTMQLSVAQMDCHDLLDIFRNESHLPINENQATILKKLFQKYDNYTMVVTLLAKQVYASGITIEELCSSADIYDYEEYVVSTKDNSVTQSTLLGHLQHVFNTAALSDEQQETLRTVWMMRDINAITKQFYKKYSGMSLNPLNSLFARGWLLYDGEIVSFHPVIEQLIERTLEPTYENCPHLYQNFLEKLSTLRDVIDRKDSKSYTGETETLFRLYVFLGDTDPQREANLFQLTTCLLDLYDRQEVSEFMWFNGWENQEYFFTDILHSLSLAKSATEEENAIISHLNMTIYSASLCCDFCRMQLEDLDIVFFSEEFLDRIIKFYTAMLWSILDYETSVLQHKNIQRQIEKIFKITQNGSESLETSLFTSYCSIYETGEYEWWIEQACGSEIVSPHKNETHWNFYVTLCLALNWYLLHYSEDKSLKKYQLYSQAFNRMNVEIIRTGMGYDHFYDFYNVPKEKRGELYVQGMKWIPEKHFRHSVVLDEEFDAEDNFYQNISYFDQKDTWAYFEEVVQTLKSSKHPFYLYRLLLDEYFCISPELKELLITWGLGKQIAEDLRLSNTQKRYLALFALKNCSSKEERSALQLHCIDSILNSNTVPQKTKYGIYNAIARKYTFDVIKSNHILNSNKLYESPNFPKDQALMKRYFPLQAYSPNKITVLADVLYAYQEKLQLTYSPEQFDQSYVNYLSKLDIDKLTKWDNHWGCIKMAHLFCTNAGTNIVMEHLAPRLLSYFAKDDIAEYIAVKKHIYQLSDQYLGICASASVPCCFCQQSVSIHEITCPHCHNNLL